MYNQPTFFWSYGILMGSIRGREMSFSSKIIDFLLCHRRLHGIEYASIFNSPHYAK